MARHDANLPWLVRFVSKTQHDYELVVYMTHKQAMLVREVLKSDPDLVDVEVVEKWDTAWPEFVRWLSDELGINLKKRWKR